ncbi:alpha/beta fold hydrolase [Nocardia grenadensis]|uniref:alpha/beta fold hydrolase n=1 Tax=Nocardia grenadensis TaxID=931537 RepID=UPI0007A4D482|nr:alpha/beta fold hydrolase [Nocardia grenadensis]
MTANDSGRTVRAGDRDIYYTDSGTGPAVVLLHGGGPGASGLAAYSRNIEELSRHFRVIVPDMPGYGRSAKRIDRSDPFGDLAASVADLLDVLELPSAHLIGNSYGGAAALRLAMDRPERAGAGLRRDRTRNTGRSRQFGKTDESLFTFRYRRDRRAIARWRPVTPHASRAPARLGDRHPIASFRRGALCIPARMSMISRINQPLSSPRPARS